MRTNLKLLAAAAAAALASSAMAQSADSPKLLDLQPKQTLLQSVFTEVGGQFYKDLGINIRAHAEAGYTWNFSNPSTGQNAFRLFDFEHDEFTLNQIGVTIERAVDYRKGKWDVGFRMDWLYGGDAGLIHSNGLFDWYDSPRTPENQFDLTQAFVDVVVPVGTGLRLRFGKFVNLVGYEAIDPTTPGVIDFYSRSFVFGSGYPFTHTGVLATYDLSKNLTLTAGVTRGDEQSLKDNNDAWSFLGSLNWIINDKMALYISNSTGCEQPGNESDYRTSWDATLYYNPTRELSTAVNAYFIYDAAGAASGDGGYLYAFAGLASYKLNDMFTVKGRVEWFHDEDGLRIPAGTNLYEATLGLTIRPLAGKYDQIDLKIRPEIRWDYSDEDVFDGDNDQFTAAVDVVIAM